MILPTSAAFAALLFSSLAAEPSQAGEKIGVAAAVTPQATSQPPGGASKTLKIGKSVVYNERIATSANGVVQVLLLDGSTFTVGPGSDLVIDKFVYNPSTGTGELAASFSKGALRFVGGKLSKNEPGVKVKTPAGTLTVRGGIFQGIVRSSNQAVFAFVFGHHLSLNRHGRRYTLNQSGNLFAIGNAARRSCGRPTPPTPISFSPPSPGAASARSSIGSKALAGRSITASSPPAGTPTSLSSRSSITTGRSRGV
ncbi:hypothetical protein AUC69_14685 [Methyloceanibacter superfactus]|uniref:FecR protein domain-containing protein n=1 Tax=Methyloceanibacter superfactus TaxID=1774969 RepID=A0A1E3VS98_9HYPH|nr:hypothetical protein AUC69_14685 [Methyloceanibacter superfactus]